MSTATPDPERDALARAMFGPRAVVKLDRELSEDEFARLFVNGASSLEDLTATSETDDDE